MPSLAKKRADLEALLKQRPPSEIDPHSTVYGVLLSDEIAFYAENNQLVSPFDRTNLKPAGYELTIGDEYFLSGEFLTLDPSSDHRNKIIIPPFEVAVLKTTEILCLPRYLIARWNIRVKYAYSGLLWVGGPQVDPGWVGHLFCPIYNLSDKPVTLRAGDPIALMDFVKTTPYNKDSKSPDLVRYPFPPKKIVLEDYGIDELQSALFTKGGAKITEFEEKIKSLDARFNFFTQISFAIFALIIALVGITSRVGAENLSLGTAIYGPGTLALSVAALLIAMFSYFNRRIGSLVDEQYGRLLWSSAREVRRFLSRAWLSGFVISTVVAILVGVGLYFRVEPFFQSHILTKSDLDSLTESVSTEFSELSTRVREVERNRLASVEDLEKLKATLEQEIQTMKSGAKPSDH
jgi:deoxycytidine triphosphate deaminase